MNLPSLLSSITYDEMDHSLAVRKSILETRPEMLEEYFATFGVGYPAFHMAINSRRTREPAETVEHTINGLQLAAWMLTTVASLREDKMLEMGLMGISPSDLVQSLNDVFETEREQFFQFFLKFRRKYRGMVPRMLEVNALCMQSGLPVMGDAVVLMGGALILHAEINCGQLKFAA